MLITYTTPTLVFKVPLDLSGCDVYATFEQPQCAYGARVEVTVENPTVAVSGGTSTVSATLTQQQTGSFHRGPLYAMLNWITSAGVRRASEPVRIDTTLNLLDEVVTHG